MNTKYLYLDSADSKTSGSPSNSLWTINVPVQGYSNCSLQLTQCSFPVGVYAFNSFRANQTLVFEEKSAATTSTVTITENNYTGAQMATHLSAIMTAGTQQANVFTVTYDSQTKKFTFAASATNFRITSTSTCLKELGFDTTAMTVAATTKVSDLPVRLDGTNYVDIMSSVSVQNLHSRDYSNILARIYITEPFGTIQHFADESDRKMNFWGGSALSSLQIQMRGDRGERYELPRNCDVSLTLTVSFA